MIPSALRYIIPFFFYNYDITIQNLEGLRVRSVGLPAWRAGDLSTVFQSNGKIRRVYDPLTAGGRGGEVQFANNVIPSNRLDPVAQKVIGFVPNANRATVDVSNEGNWVSNLPFFMTGTGGLFRYRNHVQGHNLDEDLASQIGLTGVGPDAFPRFNIGGNPGFTNLGQAGNHQRLFAFTNFEYTAHFTKVSGSQTFKFGVDYRKYPGSELGHQTASSVFDFANTDTRGLSPDGSVIAGTGRT